MSESKETTERAPRLKRAFPSYSIEDSLIVIRTLKELNGGNPWTGEELGKALERGSKSPEFYYLTAASRDYGFTEGTSRTKTIEVAPLGREYLFAPTPEDEKAAIHKAFDNVEVFKQVYQYYQGSKLPEMKYLQNNLEGRFAIDPALHEDFYRIYVANCDFMGGRDSVSRSNGVPAQPLMQTSLVVGSPTTKAQARVFVAMPFTEKTGVYPKGFYDEVLRNLITPAAVEAGFEVYTARKDGSDLIHSTIINDLIEAPIVLADLTEHNPNVLFELGFRMAQDKPVVLIRAKGTAPIFDVDNLLRVWDYNPNLWRSSLEQDIPALSKHLKGAWDNRNSDKTYVKILTGKGA